MVGINSDELDELIKKNNYLLDSLDSNIDLFKSNLANLDSCYDGNGVNFAFVELTNQNDNLKKLLDVIKNYSVILSSIKIGYQRREELIQDLLRRVSIK